MPPSGDDQQPALTARMSGGVHIIHVPAALCFYETRAQAWVEALGKVAEDLHRTPPPATRGVLLIQQSPADDRTEGWLRELRDSALFADLVHNIDVWRWTLSLIRNAPIPWIYAASSACLGSAWELALSCQRRYWYSTHALVGFPEIAAGAFPPGSVLESLSKRAGRTRERWQSRPVATAAEALSDGLVHFCSDASDWEAQAATLAQEVLKVNPKSGIRDRRRRRSRDDLAMLDAASRRAAYEQLGSVWRHERMGSHRDPSAWDYCWRLVNERAKLAQRGDLGRLICLISARHLLSAQHQAWIAAYLAETKAGVPLPLKATCLPPLVIDLNYLPPPTTILQRLLRAGQRLVFVAAEAKALAAALNLLYSRLERDVGGALAQSLWDRCVTWYHGVSDGARSLVLRWSVDDRFLIAWQQVELPFLRLDGNAATAKPGVLEWCAPADTPLPEPVAAVLALVADGLVRTPYGGLPLTVYLRSVFLTEMYSLARHADGDLGAITEGLRAAGWAFAGDDEAWDRFLRTRQGAYPYDADLAPVESQGDWEIGSWKHAKLTAKRQPSTGPRWSATALSQHMALFLGLVVQRLPVGAIADFLGGAALGLPATLGTPRTFLEERGKRRVEHYAINHWRVKEEGGTPPSNSPRM